MSSSSLPVTSTDSLKPCVEADVNIEGSGVYSIDSELQGNLTLQELPDRFVKPGLTIPDRISHLEIWKYKQKSVNLMYQTSNAVFGARPPSKQELPNHYHPQKSTFSKV